MQPEFNDADKIREIISKFEDKEIVNSIKEEDNGINIYIGSENNFDDDVTVIKTKYTNKEYNLCNVTKEIIKKLSF